MRGGRCPGDNNLRGQVLPALEIPALSAQDNMTTAQQLELLLRRWPDLDPQAQRVLVGLLKSALDRMEPEQQRAMSLKIQSLRNLHPSFQGLCDGLKLSDYQHTN